MIALPGLAGCEVVPDPCAGYALACIAVTVDNGPPDTHQLLVAVDGYSSSTPLTPRTEPTDPLAYPLRFAVRFAAPFDGFHRGQVTLDVSALDEHNTIIGEARQAVAISGADKVRVHLDLGPPGIGPADLAAPADLRAGPDLGSTPDLGSAPDLGAADGARD